MEGGCKARNPKERASRIPRCKKVTKGDGESRHLKGDDDVRSSRIEKFLNKT